MISETTRSGCTAFNGARRIASGDLVHVARKVKEALLRDEQAPILIFDDVTSEPVEIDFRGDIEAVVRRLAVRSGGEPPPADPGTAHRGPGRPRLGVVAREVTLLPRHWEWLVSQPGGASVALRKLVEEARRTSAGADRMRLARETSYRFMVAIAGDRPGFEEAARALFAGDRERYDRLLAVWPADIRDHARKLAVPAWTAE